ncbi:MAG: septal ring lytic transglycosylase RlpA family protein [Acidobacteriaceae bacterium]
MRVRCFALACGALLLITGCGHRERVAAAPPPPPIAAPNPEPGPEAGAEQVPPVRPIYSEVGIASWYGPPYNRRRGANGEIYDENAVTAAHRTLPLGSLIRVTNLTTGQSAMMHITDRGPFVPGRILDLSLGAAKELGVWRAGTARVRIDVYSTPKPIDYGGRWCVQIGAFPRARTAKKLEEHLAEEYESASVIEFTGPTGHWVRIRPENGDKSRAIQIVRTIRIKEGAAYLVRLD